MTSVRLMDRVSIALHTLVMKKKSHRRRPNKAGSVLTYTSSLVDPQIRRIVRPQPPNTEGWSKSEWPKKNPVLLLLPNTRPLLQGGQTKLLLQDGKE